MPRNFKTKISNSTALALIDVMDDMLLTYAIETPLEQLHIAVLAEVSIKLKQATLYHSKEYKVCLSPSQAIALHILYSNVPLQNGVQYGIHFGNELMLIANNIHQQFFSLT